MLTTTTGKSLAVEEITHDDLTSYLTKVNPSLAELLEAGNYGHNYTFYKANYRFGDKIIKDGQCYLPLIDGDCIAFKSDELPPKLLEDLFYDPLTEDPLGIVISKTSEFYLASNGHSQLHSLINPGQIFGTPRAVDDNSKNISTSILELNLNAGANSLFMLAKVSDQRHHFRLQDHYGMPLFAPTSLQEHHSIFVEIASKDNCPWRCEIIYFPRKWINQLKSDAWAALAKKLMIIHRESYSILHRVSSLWNQAFNQIEHEKRLNKYYSMHSIATTKQLFLFAAGAIPGFRPSTSDDTAPNSLITKAYDTIYNKNSPQEYAAIIMEPARLDYKNDQPIYYSLNYSTSNSQNHLEAANKKSNIAFLDEINTILSIYLKYIFDHKDSLHSLYTITKNTNFSFYHTIPDNYKQIVNASLLAKEDSRFMDGKEGEFPNNSQFFKGCIAIKRIP